MFKRCSCCSNEKLISEFRKDKTQKCGYQPRCKVCARAAHKSAYMEKYGEKTRIRNSERQRQQKQAIRDYKKLHPCVICKESEIVCLEFHHIDPKLKDFQLSSVSTVSVDTIMKEIEKCVVLCSNCHKKVHAGIIDLEKINAPLV